MNMKLSSRVIASMSLAALLFASTACKQPAGTSSPAPLSEDQKTVNTVAGKITGDTLTTVRKGFTPELGDKTVEVSDAQITVPAATAFDAQLKDTGVNAEIVFEGPKDATATVTKNSSEATKYGVAGGEVDEEFTVFAKLMKNKAETKVKIGTYTIKADADKKALKEAADKLNLAGLRGGFNPKATAGTVDLANTVTTLTIPSAPTVTGITASWESDNAAINVSNGAVTHPSHTAGATVCKISLKLTKNGKSKTVHVATFKVLPKAESNDDKAVVEIESLIKKNLATVQASFNPKLTSGKATVGKDVSEITVPQAATFGSDLKGVTVAVGFVGPQSATSNISQQGSSQKYTVTHGSADETWKVVAKLTKGDAIKTVEIGSYTVEKKPVPKTTALTIDTTKVTVAGEAVVGNSVALEASAKASLAAAQVVIAPAAISPALSAGDTVESVFKITVSDAKDKVTIDLKDAAKAKYTLTKAEITVTEKIVKTALTIDTTKVTVAGEAVVGNSVALEASAKASLAAAQVVIAPAAISPALSAGDTVESVFKITVSDAKDKVTIDLKDAAKAKYTLTKAEITVTQK
ncbi:MAG: hypothetical protein ACTTH8_08650 [Treponema sp.]